MSEYDPTGGQGGQDTETAAIQADLYAVKVRAKAADVEAANPKSWREVGQLFGARLKSIAAGLLELGNELVWGSVRMVRGTTSIPQATANRIEGAHQKADAIEEKKQAQPPMVSAEDAGEKVEQMLLALRARGYHVELRESVLQRWIFVVVRPEHGELAIELGTDALKQLEVQDDKPELPPKQRKVVKGPKIVKGPAKLTRTRKVRPPPPPPSRRGPKDQT